MKAISDVKMKDIIQRIKSLLIFGNWPDLSTGALFKVGNGTADDSRSNAFEVHEDHVVVAGQTLSPQSVMGVAFDSGILKDTAQIYFDPYKKAKLITVTLKIDDAYETIVIDMNGVEEGSMLYYRTSDPRFQVFLNYMGSERHTTGIEVVCDPNSPSTGMQFERVCGYY